MATRLNMVTPKTKTDGGTYWHRIGVGWADPGKGIRLVFDSLPTSQIRQDGTVEVTAMLFPAEDRQQSPQRPQQAAQQPPAPRRSPPPLQSQEPPQTPPQASMADDDDQIPF